MMTYANQLTILRMMFHTLFRPAGHLRARRRRHPGVRAGRVTDALDGLLARKLQQKTALGSFLDPMADKLLLTASFVTLTVPSVPIALHIPIWLTVLTISRDLLIAVFALIHPPPDRVRQLPPQLPGQVHYHGTADHGRRLHVGKPGAVVGGGALPRRSLLCVAAHRGLGPSLFLPLGENHREVSEDAVGQWQEAESRFARLSRDRSVGTWDCSPATRS